MAKTHWQARARFVETDASNPEHHNPLISATFGAISRVKGARFVPFFILYKSDKYA